MSGDWSATTEVKTMDGQKMEKSQEGVLPPRCFKQGAALGEVAVGLSQTINLGNYESARIEVRVSVPYQADYEGDLGAEETFKEAEAFCKAKVNAIVRKLRR